MRAAICDSKVEKFLQELAESEQFAVGLVIGQVVKSGKDYIIHFSKSYSIPKNEIKSTDEISSIDNSQLAEHALNTIRIIGGSFNILGLFVVSGKNIFAENAALQKLKTVLMDIKSTLDCNGLLYANTDELDNGDKLLFNYVTSQKNYVCKTISSLPAKSVSTLPVDWKFASKLGDWVEFETIFEFDTAYPVLLNANHFENEKKVMKTIDLIAENLSKSKMFFNGEPRDKDLSIEKFMKNSGDDTGNVKVTIYGEAPKLASDELGILKPHDSIVYYKGVVCSRVYGLHRNTVADIETYIRNDIIKSITTRMQVYYDAFLANDDGGNENEAEYNREVNNTAPPKRVFFPIGTGNISFSDYLFSHETEETTVKQALDILGIKIKKEDVDTSAESSQSNILDKILESATNSENVNATATSDSGKLILILGIIGLIIALIVSVALHQLIK